MMGRRSGLRIRARMAIVIYRRPRRGLGCGRSLVVRRRPCILAIVLVSCALPAGKYTVALPASLAARLAGLSRALAPSPRRAVFLGLLCHASGCSIWRRLTRRWLPRGLGSMD
jgi:hypothetical protein